MEVGKWKLENDLCRCCHSEGSFKDLGVTWFNEEGKVEIYSLMLQEYFNITITRLEGVLANVTYAICDICIQRLQDVSTFKQQVLTCEEKFQNMISSNNILKNTDPSSDLLVIKDHREKKRRRIAHGTNETAALLDRESDSDTPIAKLLELQKDQSVLKDNESDPSVGDALSAISLAHYETDEKIKDLHKIAARNKTKQLSANKRVAITCSTILKYTSACPFRHHKSWFQCFYCVKEFRDMKSLRGHTLETHRDVESELRKLRNYPPSLQVDISNLKCLQCNEEFATIRPLKIHFEKEHDQAIYLQCIADFKVDVSPYVCHICKQQFHVFRSLSMHMNQHYANYICDVCGKSFINTKRLKIHKFTHESGNFPCSECGLVLKTKSAEANHREKHINRVLKCQICSEPMKHYNDRVKHMSVVHNVTHKFKCQICAKEFNIRHYLTTHMRQTHGFKNRKCPECDMMFNTNHNLKNHMIKHTGEKPFKCDICCKSYVRNYTLRKHIKLSHETERKSIASE